MAISTGKIGPMGDQKLGPLFLGLNRNKRSIVLDLKKKEGRAALLKLAETADVLAYNELGAMGRRAGRPLELSILNRPLSMSACLAFHNAADMRQSPRSTI